MPTKIINYEGDITTYKADAIVNAANSSLLGGGGVDGAIHNTAGPKLLEECNQIRKTSFPDGLPEGEAVITKGYELPARYVIHTVGPVWQGGNRGEANTLYNCYYNSLKIALEHKLKTIAFPAISTGAYGYPSDKADEIALKAVRSFLELYPEAFESVIFVKFKR